MALRQRAQKRTTGSVSCSLKTKSCAVFARWISIWDPISVPERLANTARLLVLSEQLTDPVVRFWALWRRAIVLHEVGETEEADRNLEACAREASELRQPSLRWYATYYRATQLLVK